MVDGWSMDGVGATVRTQKHVTPNSRDTSPAVVVHRDTISQCRLATVTTDTGKSSVTFSSGTAGVSAGT
jgi:hypothetical protein